MNSFDENDLIAYHLDELSPSKERAIRSALNRNPELAGQSEAIAATLRTFDKSEGIPVVDTTVLDRNWLSVRASLAVLEPQQRPQAWRRVFAVGAVLALFATSGLYVYRQHQVRMPESTHGTLHDAQRATPAIHADASSELSASSQGNSGPRSLPPVERIRMTPFTPAAGPTAPLHIATLLPLDQPLQLALPQGSTPLDSAPPTPALNPAPQPSAPPSPAPVSKRKPRETDLSMGVFGDFTATRSPGYTTGSGTTLNSETRSQAAVPAAGVVATFHQQLRPSLGYSVTAGYTHTTFNYTYGASNSFAGFFQRGGIGTNILELSSAYVVQGPHSKRVTSFADVGGGMLAFLPTTSTQNDSYVFRPTAVAGAGINYKLTPHLSLRAEYRGLYFKGPDFRYMNGSIPVTSRYTLSSQPTLGLTYQFGKAAK